PQPPLPAPPAFRRAPSVDDRARYQHPCPLPRARRSRPIAEGEGADRAGADRGEPGFLSVVVMAETVWVLGRAYGLADHAIAAAIERTLQADVLVVESEQEVFAAMIALKEGHGSLADALIGGLGIRAGCSRTLTF